MKARTTEIFVHDFFSRFIIVSTKFLFKNKKTKLHDENFLLKKNCYEQLTAIQWNHSGSSDNAVASLIKDSLKGHLPRSP